MGWVADFKRFKLATEDINNRAVSARYTYFLRDRHGIGMAISPGDLSFPTPSNCLYLAEKLIELEDRRFLTHSGLDWIGIARALLESLKAFAFVQGASTITQQLIRSKYLHGRKELSRKIFEAILALLIERKYSKQEILSLYMDSVWLGPGVRGFSAASVSTFRRPIANIGKAGQLSLLGLINRPMAFSPILSKERFKRRHRKIAEVLGEPFEEINPSLYLPYRRESSVQFTCDQLLKNQIEHGAPIQRVKLNVLAAVQRKLDEVLKTISLEAGGGEAAFIIADRNDCAVVAESSWIKGQPKQDGFCFLRKIQPGSTFKTFALLSALEEGLTLDDLFDSSPYLGLAGFEKSPWKVRNIDNRYSGKISLASAFVLSDNTVFARLSERVDNTALYRLLSELGLIDEGEGHRALALGALTKGVTLSDLVAAYAAIANDGLFRPLSFFSEIQRYGGSSQSLQGKELRQLGISHASIAAIKKALAASGVSVDGKVVSGKTGTSNFGTAYLGYDDNFVYGLWLGRFEKRATQEKGHLAKRVFKRIYRALYNVLSDRELMSI